MRFMRGTSVALVAWASLTMGLGVSRSAGAAPSPGDFAPMDLALLVSKAVAPQTPTQSAAVQPGASGTPASTVSAQTDRAQQGATQTKETPTGQGPVPPPRAVYANQAAQPFQQATIGRTFAYGLELTFYEHVMRIAMQPFTREQLQGKFWPDYFDSVHVPDHWGDKDHWQVNYIGHAMSGSAFTRIWLDQREPKAATTAQYFKSLGRATVYTAILSTQYEMGPMSEASIGNVGLNPKDLGWSDYIWTPLGGALWTMAEDGIDKYALTFIDRHVPFYMVRAAARMILNPSRMLANIGQNRPPWYRPDRDMAGVPRR
jgi:hypothetical protein